jgi:hypothetical protein
MIHAQMRPGAQRIGEHPQLERSSGHLADQARKTEPGLLVGELRKSLGVGVQGGRDRIENTCSLVGWDVGPSDRGIHRSDHDRFKLLDRGVLEHWAEGLSGAGVDRLAGQCLLSSLK